MLGPAGCSHPKTETIKKANHFLPLTGNAEILQSWQGDFPVTQLKLLSENQREQGIGYIGDAKTFEAVWKIFKSGKDVPEIDFKANLVLFARNTHFYNRISIGQVNVTDGVADTLAMETMSAMPIEDKVAMSLVAVSRKGIIAVQSGDKIIPIN
ncbi:MAG: hypothetical protein JRI75_09180 [Deltaproteobacteria bacterium]|nr:hypothetical protein [Deltaproteobacteria bacterium]